MESFVAEIPSAYRNNLGRIVTKTTFINYIDDTIVREFEILYSTLVTEQKNNNVRYNKSIFLFELGKYLMGGEKGHKERGKVEIILAYIEDLISYPKIETAKSKEAYNYIINNTLFSEDTLIYIGNIVLKRKDVNDIPDRPRPIYNEYLEKIKSKESIEVKENNNGPLITNTDLFYLSDIYKSEKEKYDPYIKRVKSYDYIRKALSILLIVLVVTFYIQIIYKFDNLLLDGNLVALYFVIIYVIYISVIRQINVIKQKCNYNDINILYINLYDCYASINRYEKYPNDSNREDINKDLNKIINIIEKWKIGNIPMILSKYEEYYKQIINDFNPKTNKIMKNKEINIELLKDIILKMLFLVSKKEDIMLQNVIESLNKIEIIKAKKNIVDIKLSLSNLFIQVISSLILGFIPLSFIVYYFITYHLKEDISIFFLNKPELFFQILATGTVLFIGLLSFISARYRKN